MYYQSMGKGDPLVLIHGLGQTADAWKLQEELSEHFQLFIPTLRGHGSSSITQNMTLHYFAQDILNMLDENGIESAHFCGLSLGGVIVQEIHRQAEKRVRSMILANTTSFSPEFTTEMAIRDQERSLNSLSDKQYIKNVAKNSLYKPSDETMERAVQTFEINRKAYIPAARAIKGINYLPMLRVATTPIHIIASSNDNITPYMYNAHVMSIWANKAEMTVLKDTGHLSNIQKPRQFNQIVRNFIRQQIA